MPDETLNAAASRLRGSSVLIVEDSWHIATAMQSVLEEAGMVIAGAAATTSDADRLVNDGAPAVAVVDVKLRDGMAYRLIERLNDLGVEVVVVSGFATISMPLATVAAILQMPFSGEELIAAICAVLPAILP